MSLFWDIGGSQKVNICKKIIYLRERSAKMRAKDWHSDDQLA